MHQFGDGIWSSIPVLFVPLAVFRTVNGITSCSVLTVCYLHCLK